MIHLHKLQKLTVALALAFGIGCSSSSGSSGGPLIGDEPDIQFDDASTDMTVIDAQTNDAMGLDATLPEEDVSTSDAEIPMDLGIDAESITEDMTVEDAAIIPGPCPDQTDKTCTSLCTDFVACLGESDCPVLETGNATVFLEACLDSCGFNTSIRSILCEDQMNGCQDVLSRIFEADETLGTLCEGDYPEDSRNACADICDRTQACLADDPASAETQQTCVYQCLVQDGANARDCIAALTCDEAFEGNVQACLQGRTIAPPLVTSCGALCNDLSTCMPSQITAFGAAATIEDCRSQCELQLTTPASVACGGRLGCALTAGSVQTCAAENAEAPTCELGCLRVFECSREANPFGLSPAQFDVCVEECSETSTPESRRCSFETPCDEAYLNAFYECIESPVP
ncbi:MAG: hypothetical protein ACPGQS_01750 [Bradymonadia bacterium]